jgi:hypothetical protein
MEKQRSDFVIIKKCGRVLIRTCATKADDVPKRAARKAKNFMVYLTTEKDTRAARQG